KSFTKNFHYSNILSYLPFQTGSEVNTTKYTCIYWTQEYSSAKLAASFTAAAPFPAMSRTPA
ncbi:hypothetical protein, partial [Novacetimonas hansenii]|uniref:hypothetical protein n=1 Tax=Novacetimonas hansenii TaxID=436 RepID=UPI001C3FEF94